MTESRTVAKMLAVVVLTVALAGGAMVAAAGGDSAGTSRGALAYGKQRALFQANCGSCHKLANANTTGTAGPNLDKRFKGVSQRKISRVTKRAILRGDEGMPAGILTGKQADKIAHYVAAVAG